jgi:hypothetical protein
MTATTDGGFLAEAAAILEARALLPVGADHLGVYAGPRNGWRGGQASTMGSRAGWTAFGRGAALGNTAPAAVLHLIGVWYNPGEKEKRSWEAFAWTQKPKKKFAWSLL